jgi:hypothetical protein
MLRATDRDHACAGGYSILVLHFAIATANANLACQVAFLFLATRAPMFIASSFAATLLQCGFQIAAGLLARSFFLSDLLSTVQTDAAEEFFGKIGFLLS